MTKISIGLRVVDPLRATRRRERGGEGARHSYKHSEPRMSDALVAIGKTGHQI
ncbi:hypothetical protein PIIN_10364 [Serendipita indica DSM 11827]|uniref:Uncharacterized protein n=1 Tax=Serendipita indica (strain DSM 11827) TaxID=1109443 RepID=G4TYH8_SERID|nr:hypothetical protein PIIN_10364 [Serendipita indica DSM 11827]